MFFIFPIGHDHPIYERPWLTLTLIAACTILLGVTHHLESRVEPELMGAVMMFESIQHEHPEARVSFELEGAPEALEQMVAPLVDTTPGRRLGPHDLELEAALRGLVDVLNRVPTLAWGFRPARPDVGRLFASMFLHGGIMHLLGNMVLLWVAGGVLECFWRRWAYLTLYFGAGVAGAAAHMASNLHSFTPVVGASGAVSGLLGAFLVGYPHTKIRLAYAGWFMRPFAGMTDRPAWVIIPIWAGLELINAWWSDGSNVAHWAHVGGFVFGATIAFIAQKMHWVAEDAGRTTQAVVETLRAPGGRPIKPASEPPSAPVPAPAAARSVETVLAKPSLPATRPPLESIDISSLPPPSDDDHFS